MAKNKDVSIFLIVYAVCISYFILKTYSDPVLFSATVAFSVMAGVSLFALLYTKSDEGYYENLTGTSLLYVIGATVGMIAVSSLFMTLFISNAPATQSVLWYPTVFAQLATTGQASSIFTSLLGEMVFQFSVVATAEELLKFAGYTELKMRYKSMLLAVVVPVGLWAGYHTLQAYTNWLLVIPAFLSGLILVALLEVTKSFIAPILAHGAYNTATVLLAFKAGNVPVNVPWFPTSFTPPDLLLVGLAAMWIGFILLPVLFGRNK